MKRVVVWLMVLALAMPAAAMACTSHPSCECNAGCYVEFPTRWERTDTSHLRLEEQNFYCRSCHKLLGQGGAVPVDGGWEPHSIAGSTHTCVLCGYERPYNPPSQQTSSKPSQEQLQQKAQQQCGNCIGKWITVLYPGNVFSSPDAYSWKVKEAGVGDTFKVVDWVMNGDRMWFGVETDGRTAWVSASIAQINEVQGETGNASVYVGRQCSITVYSGNLRSGPGQEYYKLGTVLMGERYAILAADYASTGTIWYQIQCNGVTGWVSSGMCRLH